MSNAETILPNQPAERGSKEYMSWLSPLVRDRTLVEEWIKAQSTPPNRKQVKEHFPNMSMKVIRAAMASTKDKENKERV